MTYIGDPKECFIEQLFEPKESCETAQIEEGLSEKINFYLKAV